jgi:hypothetical protein
MKLLGYDLGNTLLKFCEKREYCQDIVDGNIYMKQNGYFRQLDDSYRGDRFDSRIFIEWEQERIWKRGPAGRIEETVIMADVEYGLKNDDKIPVFCASVFDGAIIDPPEKFHSMLCKEFIKEITKFGKYVVCFSLDEFLAKALLHSLENGFKWNHSKVDYFDTKAAYSQFRDDQDMTDAFPFALFKKDYPYHWQNEWRLVFRNDGNTIIPPEKDYYVMCIEPLENAKIFSIDELINALIL